VEEGGGSVIGHGIWKVAALWGRRINVSGRDVKRKDHRIIVMGNLCVTRPGWDEMDLRQKIRSKEITRRVLVCRRNPVFKRNLRGSARKKVTNSKLKGIKDWGTARAREGFRRAELAKGCLGTKSKTARG